MRAIVTLIRYLGLVCHFAASGNKGLIEFPRRFSLGVKILFIHLKLRKESATSFPEQLVILHVSLMLDKHANGHIAEFGCYKGVSSIILSIGAHMTNRRLLVFDSFEGLPEPTDTIRNIATGIGLNYKKGMYASSLEHVKHNIEQYGKIESVEFVKGFFSDTLKCRPPEEQYALIFEDADLVSSVKDVLTYAWPKLNKGGPFLCHEARDLEVCEIFFDRDFWRENIHCPAPGLVGVGMGIPVGRNGFDDARIKPLPGRFGSCLAYVFKSE